MRIKRKNRIHHRGMLPEHFEAGQLKILAYMVPICIVMALPILFIVMNAFKPIDELFAYPPRIFVRNPTLQNFVDLFQLTSQTNIPMSRYLLNSIVYTAITVILTMYISASAGFVLSKKKFKSRGLLFRINQAALMFAPVAVQIPRYFVIVYCGLADNFLANILPLLALPTGVFLVKQFIDQIPDSLIEAALLDGATDFQIMKNIIFPLIKSPLSTVAILSFSSAWNSVEASTYYINNDSLKTFSFYVSTLSNQSGNVVAGAGVSAAASLIMFLPSLILFIILQSRVMNSMVHSGIAYLPGEIMLDAGELNAPEDLFLYEGKLYIADVTEDGTGGRLLVFDQETGRTQILGEGLLVNPSGIFVNEEAIFVADKGAAAVF